MAIPLVLGALLLATLAAVARRFWRPRPDDTRRRIFSDLLAGGIIYAFAAPAIGGIGVVLALAAITLDPQTLMMMLYGLPWFYLFGAVPALLCGVVAGALRPARPAWRDYARLALVGGLFGFSFLAAFTHRDMEWSDLMFALCVGGLTGLVSAFLCAYWFYGKPQLADSAS
ncbi:hypothetical protein [Achromobacter sp. UMC46]|uniref:hypothetical protein n=1 Tax=Achromobacter sp. UMC46 TaxID=1862319 RepID=UPI0016018C6E|nr:hypothetical protein [Achromobacter sp. UMC46]MBB1592620.1 hypothetical protein [Achromobacter sp. UMC46]